MYLFYYVFDAVCLCVAIHSQTTHAAIHTRAQWHKAQTKTVCNHMENALAISLEIYICSTVTHLFIR